MVTAILIPTTAAAATAGKPPLHRINPRATRRRRQVRQVRQVIHTRPLNSISISKPTHPIHRLPANPVIIPLTTLQRPAISLTRRTGKCRHRLPVARPRHLMGSPPAKAMLIRDSLPMVEIITLRLTPAGQRALILARRPHTTMDMASPTMGHTIEASPRPTLERWRTSYGGGDFVVDVCHLARPVEDRIAWLAVAERIRGDC